VRVLAELLAAGHADAVHWPVEHLAAEAWRWGIRASAPSGSGCDEARATFALMGSSRRHLRVASCGALAAGTLLAACHSSSDPTEHGASASRSIMSSTSVARAIPRSQARDAEAVNDTSVPAPTADAAKAALEAAAGDAGRGVRKTTKPRPWRRSKHPLGYERW
jgi:hypothetical protein